MKVREHGFLIHKQNRAVKPLAIVIKWFARRLGRSNHSELSQRRIPLVQQIYPSKMEKQISRSK
jgi:hypothetical protein